MPYTIVRRDDEYCVAKESDGSIMGCHPTRQEAVAQIAAIEANENKEIADALDKIRAAVEEY